jgi:sugar lactone lactonase YvrE
MPRILLTTLLLALMVSGCQAPVSLALRKPAPSIQGRLADAPRSLKALESDVLKGATVSLMDAATGNTVASTVTAGNGAFNLNFSAPFYPGGGPYFLEAVKGLPVGGLPNRAGASIARERTLLFYAGGNWQSLTSGPVVIGRATTAVCAIASLRNMSSSDELSLVGHVNGLGFSPIPLISLANFEQVYGLVTQAIESDQDPLEAVGYDPTASAYAKKPGSVTIYGSFSPTVASTGSVVVFNGQNFPTDPSTVVSIGQLPVSNWRVNAGRTQLSITLSANAHSGTLQINQGSSRWNGPFVPVHGTVGSIAGSGYAGYSDGSGSNALLNWPHGMAFDAQNNLYFVDYLNQRIRKVTPAGLVATVAGNGVAGFADGTGAAAQFDNPLGLAIDATGDLYVGDMWNNRIREITPAGVVSTLAGDGNYGHVDAVGSAAEFEHPYGVAVDATGNVYVADELADCIRKIAPSGMVTTVAGQVNTPGFADGVASAAQFRQPYNLVADTLGNLYITDTSNHRIRCLASNGQVTTVAGNGTMAFADGTASSAEFQYPNGIALDASGNLAVADIWNHRIRLINLSTHTVSTLAGSGTLGYLDALSSGAQFDAPQCVVFDAHGNLYVSDKFNQRIRVITP